MRKITYICDNCGKIISETVKCSPIETYRVDILTNSHRNIVNFCKDCFTKRFGDLFPDSERMDTEVIDE